MKKDKTNIKKYTKQFYKGNIVNFAFALSDVVMAAIASLLVSWLIQQLIDLMSNIDTGFNLKQLTIITIAIIFLVILAYLIASIFKPRFITRGISQYKEYVFKQLTNKNIQAFSKEGTSSYLSALTNDISVIQQAYLTNTFTIVSSTLTFIGALVMMVIYSPLLTVVAIALSFLPLLAALLTGDKLAVKEKEVSDKNESYTATLKDCLSGFSVIKSFKAEKQMIQQFQNNIKQLSIAQTSKERVSIIISMFSDTASTIAQLGVFIFGAFLAINGGNVTAGTTMVFVQLMNYVLNPIGTLPVCFAQRKAAKALIEKVADSMNKNVRDEKENKHYQLNNSLTINDLSFSYDSEKEVLHHLNYKFDSGKKYAIVGSSGSGKSTLLNLLLAANDNYSGSINYDEVELRDINSSNLYEIESVIQQNVFIFNASIKGITLQCLKIFQKIKYKELLNNLVCLQ